MTLLAIDTASDFCAACLWDENAKLEHVRRRWNHRSRKDVAQNRHLERRCVSTKRRNALVLAQKSENIGRGHAERLIGLIDDVFKGAGLTPDNVTKIAVSVGPGSFTGIRVGVATARGLALAIGVDAVGVSTLEALAHHYVSDRTPQDRFAVTMNGGRGQIFAQKFDAHAVPLGAPFVLSGENDDLSILDDARILIGDAAEKLDATRHQKGFDVATAPIASYAQLGYPTINPPKPLYLRAADAKVQQGFALPHASQTSL